MLYILLCNLYSLKLQARVGVSVLTSLNNINPSSFQHEYIFLFITKSSNLPMESLSIIAPAIHIHNRKHISHSTSCLKTYRTTPRQTISPQRHHANRTAPHFGGQTSNERWILPILAICYLINRKLTSINNDECHMNPHNRLTRVH